jgi:hypothetical protein
MDGLQLPLGEIPTWIEVDRDHPVARRLADRHYSRQTVGAREFMGPGETLVMLTPCGRAVWGVIRNKDGGGSLNLRCTIFRNEGAGLSSTLIAAATGMTQQRWPRQVLAGLRVENDLRISLRFVRIRLRTEVDANKVRSTNPGCCFKMAGWTLHPQRTTRGLLVYMAPE